MNERMLTPQQVADYLEVRCTRVYQLIKKGDLPATKVGRSYQIADHNFSTYLVTHTGDPSVQKALFNRILEIGKRNPELDGDEFLDWLEEQDRKRLG